MPPFSDFELIMAALSQIVQVLDQALDSNPGARKRGEDLLESLSTLPGFGHALVHASLQQVSRYDQWHNRILKLKA